MRSLTRDMDGEVAIVTGASSGIGAATARALADEGMAVALAARRADRLESLAADIDDGPGEALVVPTDVTDRDAVDDLVAETVEAFGGLDTLVNNAGVMLLQRVADADPDDWRTMVEVNLLGLMHASKAALPHLRGGGDLVQVSSVAGRTTSQTAAGYNATKWGVNGFTDALRKEETENGVRTTIVEPGAVDTELQDHIPDEEVRERLEGWVESMDALQPDDIAAAVLYAVGQPRHVSVNELMVRPTDQR
ncbi:SDR family NAD(P)-dependent oxidoreductase [Haloglomus litoreum]|uniref:SDR family NAD(P)-dependent oxidoreductase n=1 Tax=Haloglomus litoreum TaxID=3034026 RepID=UPI0023E7784E|nr:SDR family NAD(P)-dependent oxidoreductase [Haloglomus sp. DT116]